MSQALTKEPWLDVGGVLAAGLAVLWLTRSRSARSSLAPLLKPMVIRVDAGGDGHFGSGRIGHAHHGIDLVCRPGQAVYAPFSGRITREAIPYSDDKQWRGLVLESGALAYQAKVFYCTPLTGIIGRSVEQGQLIGYCQGISKRYGSRVHDHLHLEIRKAGTLLNPESLFTLR